MATADQFRKNMGALATRVARNADKVVRKAALVADQAVVMQTPVDTGRARANWIANLNAPNASTTEGTDKGGGKAIQQAAGVVAAYDGDRDTAIHITNNLPYIMRLNEGSSYQAPADFVRIALRRGISAIKGAKLLDPMVD